MAMAVATSAPVEPKDLAHTTAPVAPSSLATKISELLLPTVVNVVVPRVKVALKEPVT